MAWKNIPKTKVGELLGVHRNTVAKLYKSGHLKGFTAPDVVDYVKKVAATTAILNERERILCQVKEAMEGEHVGK